MLVALHCVRPAPSVWTHSKNTDKSCGRHIHSKFGPAQLGCQPDHLLPLLRPSLSCVQVSFNRTLIVHFLTHLCRKFPQINHKHKITFAKLFHLENNRSIVGLSISAAVDSRKRVKKVARRGRKTMVELCFGPVRTRCER